MVYVISMTTTHLYVYLFCIFIKTTTPTSATIRTRRFSALNALKKSVYCPNSRTRLAQGANPPPGNSPQGVRLYPPAARRQTPPPPRAERRCARMAGRGKNRGNEHKRHPRPARPGELAMIMRRSAERPAPCNAMRGSGAAAQMQPRPQRGRQPRVAGDDERQPPGPAQARHRLGQPLARRMGIMTEQHATQPGRQPPDNRQRVR